jgi:ribonuclease HI
VYFEAGILPFEKFVMLSSAKYICRAKCVANSIGPELDEESQHIKNPKAIPDLQSIHDFTKPLLDTDLIKFDTMAVNLPPPIPPWELARAEFFYDFSKFSKSHEPQLAMLEAKTMLNTYFQHHLHVFTDGSRISFDSVGSAFFVPQYNLAYSASVQSGASNYTAELLAIHMALEHFVSMRQLPLRICIASDSRGALVALDRGKKQERANLIAEILINTSSMIQRGCDVAFLWVPSHVGIRGNEKADSAAYNAALKLNHQTYFEPGLTAKEAGTLLTEKAWTLWKQEYVQIARTKGWFIQSPPTKKFDVPINGHNRGLFHRLRTNAWRFKFVDSANVCRCGEKLSIQHFLLKCPRRKPIADALSELLKTLDLPLGIESLLNENPKTGWSLSKAILEIFYKDPQGCLF